MLFPHARRAISPLFLSVPESPCRSQRRKLARRPKTSSQTLTLSNTEATTDPIVAGRAQHPAVLMNNEQPIEGIYHREMFLRAIVEACASNVAVLDDCGNILYVSKPWRLSAEKYAPQGGSYPLDLHCLERQNGPNAERSNYCPALAEDIQAILDGKATEFHNEYSCPGPSGLSWFVIHAARLDLPGTTGGFRILVNSSDITRTRQTEELLRDLGGRLITAQEEERSRVARELHDDLNQRMALLSVELEQLSQKLPASQSKLRFSINNVWQQAQEISTEIHRMAYQLHPSKLDHLGLVAAVKSHCLELAAHHEIEIAFKEKGCSDLLSKDVTLCLFRIVQESFRNIIKHSGARAASVVLVGTPNAIHLSVSDTGRGFDVHSLESKNGLGLISIRERLRLVGGVISIHSTPQGTKIEVSVPINSSDIRSTEMPLPGSGSLSHLCLLNEKH
jgi:signal transduction histidine kinase